MAIANIFSERLCAARKQMGITQAELARRMNIQRATLKRYEHGLLLPSFETLLRLSKALGVTTDHLIGCATLKEAVLHVAKGTEE